MNLTHAPLDGIGVLVARPRDQATRLMQRIADLGGRVWWLPGVDILPPHDPAALEAALSDLPRCLWAIFVSPTAVERAWPLLEAHGGLPAGLRLAAVGQGSARELAARGMRDILAPEGKADSESLLALPEMQTVAGKGITIFHGEGGRELLADTLAARGAQVSHAVCYRRAPPQADTGEVLAAWQAGRIQAVTVFSRDNLDGLCMLLGPQGTAYLRQTPVFVPHPRIAEHARSLGIEQVVATPSGEDGVLGAMLDRFDHVPA